MNPVSVHDVAARLAELQVAQTRRANGLAAMATSKLHKLCYLTQAYHLAWTGEPLYAEDTLAAHSGPVIAELFGHHEGTAHVDAWSAGDAGRLSDRQRKIIDSIFESYSHTTGMFLSEITRGHVPWIRARAQMAGDDDRPVISHADMGAFYRALNDAPRTPEDYAARFMDRYAEAPEPEVAP